MGDVIATETKIVTDEAIGIDRQVIAGQKIPADLVEPYKQAGGTVAGAGTAAPATSSADPFAAHVADSSIKDLLAEVDGDQAAAQRVLAAEQARGDDARATLVEALEKQLADTGE